MTRLPYQYLYGSNPRCTNGNTPRSKETLQHERSSSIGVRHNRSTGLKSVEDEASVCDGIDKVFKLLCSQTCITVWYTLTASGGLPAAELYKVPLPLIMYNVLSEPPLFLSIYGCMLKSLMVLFLWVCTSSPSKRRGVGDIPTYPHIW